MEKRLSCIAVLITCLASATRAQAADPLHDAAVDARAALDAAKKARDDAQADLTTKQKAAVDKYALLSEACTKNAKDACPLKKNMYELPQENVKAWVQKAGLGDKLTAEVADFTAKPSPDAYSKLQKKCQEVDSAKCPLPSDPAELQPGQVDDLLANLVPSLATELESFKSAGEQVKAAEATLKTKSKEVDKTQRDYDVAAAREATASDPQPNSTFVSRLTAARHARCSLAACWGGKDGTKYALEFLADVPLGYYFGVGETGVTDYINANPVSAKIQAGIRFWFAYDILSLGVVFVNIDLTKAREIHIANSTATFSRDELSMSYPGLQLGIGADVLTVTGNVVELRNPDDSSRADPHFGPNQVVSRGAAVGIAISPLTLGRTLAAAASKKEDKTP